MEEEFFFFFFRSCLEEDFMFLLQILPSVTPIDYEGYAQVIIEENVKIVETAGDIRLCDECLQV